jgi:hypothetical protein
MVDDRIPEEREERNQQLIALLRHGLREPAVVSSPEQSEIIARVQDRLMEADVLAIGIEGLTAQYPGQTASDRIVSVASRRRHLARFVRDLVAILIVGILVGASFLVFRSLSDRNAAHLPIDLAGPTAHSEVNGLKASIHVLTPGPYFLSELVSLNVELTNQTGRPFSLTGSGKPDIVCASSALNAQVAGSDPAYAVLPRLDIACLQPGFVTTLAPGQTLTLHYYLPVTKSGEVTIAMSGMIGPHQPNPLDGHWPSVSIQVDSHVPSNRVLTLKNQGAQVLVQAPPTAEAHLLYMQSITCDQYWGGSALDWSPLPTPMLSQPACPTAHKHWQYIVSAPGFAIVAGSRDA